VGVCRFRLLGVLVFFFFCAYGRASSKIVVNPVGLDCFCFFSFLGLRVYSGPSSPPAAPTLPPTLCRSRPRPTPPVPGPPPPPLLRLSAPAAPLHAPLLPLPCPRWSTLSFGSGAQQRHRYSTMSSCFGISVFLWLFASIFG